MSFDLEGTEIASSKKRVSADSKRCFKILMEELSSNPKEPLILDWEDGKVTLTRGGVVVKEILEFNTITLNRSRKHYDGRYQWVDDISQYSDIGERFLGIRFQKDMNTYLTKALGCSPIRFLRMLQACLCKAFIPEDLSYIARKFCRQQNASKLLSQHTVRNLWLRRDIIRQCILDDQLNIIPFILHENDYDTANVPALRKKLGKGLWKKLLRNSPTRNKLIAIHAADGRLGGVRTLNELPSSLLKLNTPSRLVYTPDIARILRDARLLTKLNDSHAHIVNLVNDTKGMYARLGMDVPKQSSRWAFEKWSDKHDWCTREVNALTYSKDPIEWLSLIPQSITSDCGRFTATVLQSPFDIACEGSKMHHCVAGYERRVSKGFYVVVHISCEGDGKGSTLGLALARERVYIQQHYHACNIPVKDIGLIEFASVVERELSSVVGDSRCEIDEVLAKRKGSGKLC